MSNESLPSQFGQSDRLYRRLVESLTHGAWVPGERLPSERVLSEQFGCSRGALRKALERLIHENLIYSKERVGNFVTVRKPLAVTHNFALVVKSIHANFAEYPYLNRLVQGFVNSSSTARFLFNVFIISPDENFFEGVKRMKISLHLYDGFIFAWALNDFEITELKRRNVNFVGLTKPQSKENISYIDIDNRHGAYLAIRHLLAAGRRKPVLLNGVANVFYNQEKIKGFRKALTEEGIPFDEERMVREIDPDDGELARQRIQELLADRERLDFDSLLVYGDWATYATVRELQKNGIQVPEDVEVVMYDDYSWVPKALELSMTVVHQPIEEQIQSAVRLLLRQLEDEALVMVQFIRPTLVDYE